MKRRTTRQWKHWLYVRLCWAVAGWLIYELALLYKLYH